MRNRSVDRKWSLVLILGILLLGVSSLVYFFTAGKGIFAPAVENTGQAHRSTPTITATSQVTCKQQNFQTGVAFPQWSPDGYGSTDTQWRTEIAAIRTQTAACWLEMPVLFFQDTPSSTTVKTAYSTPTVASFTAGINAAHALGFHVFVTPLLDITGPQTWSGYIQFSTYEQEQQWFAGYWQALKPYVTAAAQAGLEQLSIGTEEAWLQNNAPDSLWNGLIANIRSVFSGTLTYDTNWSDVQTQPPAWMHNADLQMIGVSGYFSLVDTPTRVDPTQIAALWKEKAQPLLDNFANMLGKPIILSEVGYRNSSDALYHAWDSTSTAPADPEEQAAACDAVLVNSISDGQIVGSFFWGWDEVGGFTLKGQRVVTVLHNRYASL